MIRYINRHMEDKVRRYVKQFPVVVLTGPRQAGKSTLLKHLFSKEKNWEYVNLDHRGVWERISSDPDLFAKDIDSNIIIDEAQKAPALFHSIKWRVDDGMKHKIILSGSANFQLLHKVTETLAGRTGVLELFPFTINEKSQKANILELLVSSPDIDKVSKTLKDSKPISDDMLFEHLLWGGYPKLLEYKKADLKLSWFENYRTTYIERDLRDLTQIADISGFQKFHSMLAFRIGGVLNLSSIANDIGVSVPTCKKYLQILEASYQYFQLKPYHINVSKRLIKSSKIYILDTGICNYFLGVDSLRLLRGSGSFGNIFENFAIAEILKQNSLLPRKNNLYFWRTSNGAEVDLIIEKGNNIIPIEIKSGIRIAEASIRGLTGFMNLKIDRRIKFGIVFYRGDRVFKITDKILAVPIGCI